MLIENPASGSTQVGELSVTFSSHCLSRWRWSQS